MRPYAASADLRSTNFEDNRARAESPLRCGLGAGLQEQEVIEEALDACIELPPPKEVP
jgi:hypothetical protein